nr:immunoglobulin light chain junction region [Macaca mulatta]
CQQNSGSPTF